jgi:mannose/fructose/N-acetylgalactosamine-specific phosphotransferase system component IIC
MHLASGFVIRLLAVYLLFVLTGVTIMRFHKFFIGHKDENLKRGDYRQLEYFFFMTIFLAAVSAHLPRLTACSLPSRKAVDVTTVATIQASGDRVSRPYQPVA